MSRLLDKSSLEKISIDQINLSVRANNCLKKSGIFNLADLMLLTSESMSQIRNMGAKTIEEILIVQQQIHSSENILTVEGNSTKSKDILVKEMLIRNQIPNYTGLNDNYEVNFLNLFGQWVDDIHVDDLKLSVRSFNALMSARIETAQAIAQLKYSELKSLDNIGNKSVDEIINRLKERSQVIDKSDSDIHFKLLKNFLSQILCDDRIPCEGYLDTVAIESRARYIFSLFSQDELKRMSDYIEHEAMTHTEIESILEQYIYSDEVIKNLLENYAIEMIKNYSLQLSVANLIEKMPLVTQKGGIAQTIIDNLISNKQVELIDGKLRIYYPSIYDYIATIPKSQIREILEKRLLGQTLEEIGSEFDVSRERIRQIVAREIRRRPYVREDEYKSLFTQYNFDKEIFLTIFNEEEYVYNYLNLAYRRGNKSLEELVEDTQINASIRKKAFNEVYRDYLHLDNRLIKKNRQQISHYLISKYAVEEIEFEKFSDIYHAFLEEHKLSDKKNLQYPLRTMENALASYEDVVWKYGRRFRYYPINMYDFEELFQRINWKQYQNVEISTYKIFCDYPEVMQDYDIKDEYEFHNIIKKLPTSLVGENVTISRMPYLGFGEYDRDMQLIDLMIELAPIGREDLAKAFEEKYGHRQDTMLGYFSKAIDDYYDNGIYCVDVVPFSSDELKLMKELLSEEFYFLDEIKDIYLKNSPNADSKKVNTYNLKSLGFKVNSSYAFVNSYQSSETFFNNLLTRNDSIDITGKLSKMWNLQSFAGVVQELRDKFDILEYAPSQFIHFRRLAEMGITKQDLKDYINQIVNSVDEDYFTVYSLRLRGDSHQLDELGLDDWFYASLLRLHSSIQYVRLRDSFLLKKNEKKISVATFLADTMARLGSIEVYDYIEWVQQNYGFSLDRGRLLETLKTTTLYYDKIMDKIYLDYETYYQEI